LCLILRLHLNQRNQYPDEEYCGRNWFEFVWFAGRLEEANRLPKQTRYHINKWKLESQINSNFFL